MSIDKLFDDYLAEQGLERRVEEGLDSSVPVDEALSRVREGLAPQPDQE